MVKKDYVYVIMIHQDYEGGNIEGMVFSNEEDADKYVTNINKIIYDEWLEYCYEGLDANDELMKMNLSDTTPEAHAEEMTRAEHYYYLKMEVI